jgi:hypothetical protein
MSNAIAGVIGAIVTLVVMLGAELLFIFVRGLTLKKKCTALLRNGGRVVGKDTEHISLESGI